MKIVKIMCRKLHHYNYYESNLTYIFTVTSRTDARKIPVCVTTLEVLDLFGSPVQLIEKC